MSTYRERRERRVDRLDEWADKNEAKSGESFDKARDIVEAWPMGQPILVGHHSEKRHRRDIARHESAMDRAVELDQKATRQRESADNISRELDRSIYSDDADAIERLEARIAKLERERVRVKEINAFFRKHKIDLLTLNLADDSDDVSKAVEMLQPLNLTHGEFADIVNAARFSRHGKGYPSYHLTNLGGNINRQKKRLAKLQSDAERRANLDTATRHTVTLTAEAVELGNARGNQRNWWLRDDLGEFHILPDGPHPGDGDLAVTLELPDGAYILGCGTRRHGVRIHRWIVNGQLQ